MVEQSHILPWDACTNVSIVRIHVCCFLIKSTVMQMCDLVTDVDHSVKKAETKLKKSL